jgi:5-methyltetrahydrofolate--homocysteine methyltransferase
MMAAIVTAETLAGKDEWCSEYLQAYRQKRFEF